MTGNYHNRLRQVPVSSLRRIGGINSTDGTSTKYKRLGAVNGLAQHHNPSDAEVARLDDRTSHSTLRRVYNRLDIASRDVRSSTRAWRL